MKKIFLPIPIFAVLFFSGCFSTNSIPTYQKPLSAYKNSKTYQNINISEALLAHYKEWEGVKYRYGGESKNGIDCSFFVKDSFTTLKRKLPRTTYFQAKSGIPISKQELKMGDLVFFITSKKGTRHVGIYLDDGDFMHVSTSNGVMISNLENSYWKKHYWKSRRVLKED